jgi:hypothetical protein
MNNGSPTSLSPVAYPPQAAGSGLPNSPSLLSNLSLDGAASPVQHEDMSRYFFQEKYVPLNVKGNFLTLCACPKNVELGEWLAHQSMFTIINPELQPQPTLIHLSIVVEQYRLLHGMLQVIQEVNTVTGLPICNENTCPTMSAGRCVLGAFC